jgi:hypothetical protein
MVEPRVRDFDVAWSRAAGFGCCVVAPALVALSGLIVEVPTNVEGIEGGSVVNGLGPLSQGA